MTLKCEKCGGNDLASYGISRKKPRYRCRSCGCHFMDGYARIKVNPEGKALAVELYGRGKSSYRFIGWLVGDRSAATFEKFFEWFKSLEHAVFYTGDYEAYRKIIPESVHVTGKKHTIGIGQNNSNIRHFLRTCL